MNLYKVKLNLEDINVFNFNYIGCDRHISVSNCEDYSIEDFINSKMFNEKGLKYIIEDRKDFFIKLENIFLSSINRIQKCWLIPEETLKKEFNSFNGNFFCGNPFVLSLFLKLSEIFNFKELTAETHIMNMVFVFKGTNEKEQHTLNCALILTIINGTVVLEFCLINPALTSPFNIKNIEKLGIKKFPLYNSLIDFMPISKISNNHQCLIHDVHERNKINLESNYIFNSSSISLASKLLFIPSENLFLGEKITSYDKFLSDLYKIYKRGNYSISNFESSSITIFNKMSYIVRFGIYSKYNDVLKELVPVDLDYFSKNRLYVFSKNFNNKYPEYHNTGAGNLLYFESDLNYFYDRNLKDVQIISDNIVFTFDDGKKLLFTEIDNKFKPFILSDFMLFAKREEYIEVFEFK